MYKIRMSLRDPQSPHRTCTLEWKVLDNPVSLLWMKFFKQMSVENKKFYPRFTGFVSPHKDMPYIQSRLNRCIEIINESGVYHIPERSSARFDQEFANVIHHHFELLIGAVDKPSDYYLKANPFVRKAIGGINHGIHDMEALDRSLKTRSDAYTCALIMECYDVKRYRLPPEFYRSFSLDSNFGNIVMHYSQIGKTWWEVFLDRDEEIFPEAIRPHDFITGELDVMFSSYRPDANLITEFHAFLKDLGQDPKDPSLRLGFIQIAEFLPSLDVSEKNARGLIAEHLQLDRVSLMKDSNEIAAVLPSLEAYDIGL